MHNYIEMKISYLPDVLHGFLSFLPGPYPLTFSLMAITYFFLTVIVCANLCYQQKTTPLFKHTFITLYNFMYCGTKKCESRCEIWLWRPKQFLKLGCKHFYLCSKVSSETLDIFSWEQRILTFFFFGASP